MQLPNICRNSVLLGVIMYTQLFVFLRYLLIERDWALESLGYSTLYAQWVVLGSLFLLCKLRHKINNYSHSVGLLLSSGICFLVFVFVELVSQYLTIKILSQEQTMSLWLYRSLAALLIIFLVHRLIAMLQTLEERNKAETSARIQALQSRIRPHFLFNSLNTISELTVTEPKQAEQAIDSLSLLFRASLESDKRFHSLENELNLCKRYIELERWRLDSRLDVEWSIDVVDVGKHQVPKLILQPLIENGIVHGVDDEGQVHITIDVRETKRDLSLVVENNKGTQNKLSEGHGIAIDNIRERLFVLYDDQQTFRVRDTKDKYSVLMRFPKQNINQLSERS